MTQNYALKQLSNYKEINLQITELKASREQLVSDLEKISFIEEIYPSDANFLLIKVDDANYRYQQLIENKIVIRNRTNQPLCENCLRISIGTKTENELLIKTLQQL